MFLNIVEGLLELLKSQDINVKATYENESRRFCINEAKFEKLKQSISNLFSLHGPFIVKYKDNENDLVTISSDEELAFAAKLFSTTVMHIFIEVPQNNTQALSSIIKPIEDAQVHVTDGKREQSLSKPQDLEGPDSQANPGFWKQEPHNNKKWRNNDNVGTANNKNHGRRRQPLPLAAKKEKIQASLAELERSDVQAHPNLQRKKERLEQQLRTVEGKLLAQAKLAGSDCSSTSTVNMAESSLVSPTEHSAYTTKIEPVMTHLEPVTHNVVETPLVPPTEPTAGTTQIEVEVTQIDPEQIEPVDSVVATVPGVTEPSGVEMQATTMNKQEIKRIREELRNEKEEAVAQCQAQIEAYKAAKSAGQSKEELEKLQVHLDGARNIVIQKKKAFSEFNAKIRADKIQKN